MTQARLHLFPDRFVNVSVDRFLVLLVNDARQFGRDDRDALAAMFARTFEHRVRTAVQNVNGDDITFRLD